MHIASLVMGIVSLMLSWIPIWGFVLAIVALVISIIAMVTKKAEEKDKGMKIAGIILSIIATGIALIITVSSALLLKLAANTSKEIIDDVQNVVIDVTDDMEQVVNDFENSVDLEADEETDLDNLVDEDNNNEEKTNINEQVVDKQEVNKQEVNKQEEVHKTTEKDKENNFGNTIVENNTNQKKPNTTGQKVDSQEHLEQADEELSKLSSLLQRQILQGYDDKIISGIQAKSAISQYITSEDITVILMNADKTKMIATVGAKKIANGTIISKGSYYEIDKNNYFAEGGTVHKTSISDFTSEGIETYIMPSKNYKAMLLKISGTDIAVGIVLSIF